jgi:hypothetical protein
VLNDEKGWKEYVMNCRFFLITIVDGLVGWLVHSLSQVDTGEQHTQTRQQNIDRWRSKGGISYQSIDDVDR